MTEKVWLETALPLHAQLRAVDSPNGHSAKRITWAKPHLLLDRGIIHGLANMSKDDIISELYEAIHTAEVKNASLAKKQKDGDLVDSLRFIPKERVQGFVYFISGHDDLIKIGCSKDPQRRLKELKHQYKKDLEIECEWQSPHMYYHEAKLHNLFSTRRIQGEWFDIEPWHANVVNWAIRRGRI